MENLKIPMKNGWGAKGKVPWGYRYDKFRRIMYAQMRQLTALEEVKPLVEEGYLSLREAAAYVTMKANKRISHEGLRLRLKMPIYVFGELDECNEEDDSWGEEGVREEQSEERSLSLGEESQGNEGRVGCNEEGNSSQTGEEREGSSSS